MGAKQASKAMISLIGGGASSSCRKFNTCQVKILEACENHLLVIDEPKLICLGGILDNLHSKSQGRLVVIYYLNSSLLCRSRSLLAQGFLRSPCYMSFEVTR